ncbi:transcriptional regulator [Solibacillus sp. R5-41]|nr:helix-turn-helix domain-containing protein [Solibacillus sp. R5-41]ATP42405.1 transcriptional regulator [Solibacillus sp. R5-41]
MSQYHETKVCNKVEAAYQLIGKKWMCFIIHSLMKGPKRFSEINATIPELSKRMLTERMKELEESDVVLRNVIADRPVRTEYSLTTKGYDLGLALRTVENWADQWM